MNNQANKPTVKQANLQATQQANKQRSSSLREEPHRALLAIVTSAKISQPLAFFARRNSNALEDFIDLAHYIIKIST